MPIEAQVNDPTQLIARVTVATIDRKEWIVIEYNGEEPLYRLDAKPMRATLTVKEGRTRRKAIVELSGILSFRPREVPDRCVIVRPGVRPVAPV